MTVFAAAAREEVADFLEALITVYLLCLIGYIVTSFVFSRVIDPTVPDALNPKNVGFSPTGGKALIAYDETGGGNAVYSKQLVNSFRLSAYIDTGALNSATAADATDSEASIYGIGTTDRRTSTTGRATSSTGTGTSSPRTSACAARTRSWTARGPSSSTGSARCGPSAPTSGPTAGR